MPVISAAGADQPSADQPGADQPSADRAWAAMAVLADFLRDSMGVGSAVEAAFRQVPRHLFLPELTPQLAYLDESIVVKVGPDQMPVSSSSQPTMMAIMLDQLRLAAGHRVLEIGAGTGYNAALMASIVGDSGSVVTVDIDAEICARARASLAATGYDRVQVICADGAIGYPDGSPYDRIILTVGAWDFAPAWLGQLEPDGRIVLPLSVRGVQLSVALDRIGEHLVSRSAVRCGFIKMAGALAGPETLAWATPDPAVRLQTDDGRPVDAAALYAALNGPGSVVVADLPDLNSAELNDADLWLTLAEPGLLRVIALGDAQAPAVVALRPFGGLAETGRADGRLGVAMLGLGARTAAAPPDEPEFTGQAAARQSACEQPAAGQAGDRAALVVRGYGPGGAELAGYLAARAVTWHRLGRPGVNDLLLRLYPAGYAGPFRAGSMVFRRPRVTLELNWPR